MEAGIFPARYSKKIFLVGVAGSLLGLVLSAPASAQTAGPLQRIGTSSFDEIFEVAADATGVYVAGRTSGLLGQTSSGGIDAFVQKYGPGGSGAPLWTDQLGAGFAYGVATDGTSVYVTGAADAIFPGGVGVGGRDIFLRKYDLSLVPIWTRQFGTPMADYSTAVALDGAGGIYIAGTTQGTLPGQTAAGGGDAFVSKFDANGDLLWTRQFGSPGLDQPVCVAANSTFVYVCGSVRGTLPGQPQAFLGVDDAFVRQYTASGDAGWTKQTGTAGGDIAAAVAVDGTDVYVVGNENIGLVRKYDSGGNQLWTQSFTISETLSAAVADAAGVYVAGSTFATLPGQTRAGLSDPFVRRYSGSGSVIWTLQFGSTNDDLTAGMASNSTGLYVAGRSGSPTGDFDGFLSQLTVPPTAAPAVFPGGVVNNGSFAPNPAPVAPGSIAAVFGTNLNDGSTVLSSSFGPNGRLVTTLGGANVTLNGIAAPMFYSTPGQLGIQIPFEMAGQTSASIVVTTGGQSSAQQAVPIDAFAPGVFTLNQQGTGTAAVLHQNFIPVSPGNPARPDEVLVFFATGLGVVTPPLATGAPSAGNQTATVATATVDGIPAAVTFSGTAPGFVGLNQINVRVPPGTRTAPNIVVVFSIGGKQSSPVTIPVAP